jgi:hypothetical protein
VSVTTRVRPGGVQGTLTFVIPSQARGPYSGRDARLDTQGA